MRGVGLRLCGLPLRNLLAEDIDVALHPDVLDRRVPVKRVQLADGEALVATVFVASLLGSVHCAGMCGGFVTFYAAADPTTGLRRDWQMSSTCPVSSALMSKRIRC